MSHTRTITHAAHTAVFQAHGGPPPVAGDPLFWSAWGEGGARPHRALHGHVQHLLH